MHKSVIHFAIGMMLTAWLVFLPSVSLAFDCSKASTKTELTICNTPQLLEIDENMELAYFSMIRRLDKKPAKLLRKGQRNWLKFRRDYCEGEASCLIDEDQTRLDVLDTASRYSPQIVPLFFWQKGTSNTYTIKLNMPKFAYPQTPGQTAFNREIDALINAAPFNEKTGEQGIGPWERETVVEITQLTRNVVSAQVFTYEFTGGAHPNSYASAINFNLRNGRRLATKDVFSFGAIERLSDDCRTMLIETKSKMYNQPQDEIAPEFDSQYGEEISKHINDMTTWHFNQEGATITFNPYEIGPYVEGEFTCKFSHKVLQRLAREPGLIGR